MGFKVVAAKVATFIQANCPEYFGRIKKLHVLGLIVWLLIVWLPASKVFDGLCVPESVLLLQNQFCIFMMSRFVYKKG